MKRRSAIKTGALGITLTELLVALAVVALLTAIAIPSYQYQLSKARRVTMQNELVRLAQRMERIYSETGCYNPGADNDCTTTNDAGNPALATSVPYYTIAFPEAVTADSFRLRATPIEQGPQDGDGIIEINHLGQRSWDENDDGDVVDDGENDWSRG